MRYLFYSGVLLLFACTSAAYAVQGQSGITGQITDSEGAVIENARVLIHWDPAGSNTTPTIRLQEDVIVRTDRLGKYSADVPAGFYDVFVSAVAFSPVAKKVRIKEGHSAISNFMLRADPLVLEETADTFPPGPKPKHTTKRSPKR